MLLRNQGPSRLTFYYIAATDGDVGQLSLNTHPPQTGTEDPLSFYYTRSTLLGSMEMSAQVTIILQQFLSPMFISIPASTVIVNISIIG